MSKRALNAKVIRPDGNKGNFVKMMAAIMMRIKGMLAVFVCLLAAIRTPQIISARATRYMREIGYGSPNPIKTFPSSSFVIFITPDVINTKDTAYLMRLSVFIDFLLPSYLYDYMGQTMMYFEQKY